MTISEIEVRGSFSLNWDEFVVRVLRVPKRCQLQLIHDKLVEAQNISLSRAVRDRIKLVQKIRELMREKNVDSSWMYSTFTSSGLSKPYELLVSGTPGIRKVLEALEREITFGTPTQSPFPYTRLFK